MESITRKGTLARGLLNLRKKHVVFLHEKCWAFCSVSMLAINMWPLFVALDIICFTLLYSIMKAQNILMEKNEQLFYIK